MLTRRNLFRTAAAAALVPPMPRGEATNTVFSPPAVVPNREPTRWLLRKGEYEEMAKAAPPIRLAYAWRDRVTGKWHGVVEAGQHSLFFDNMDFGNRLMGAMAVYQSPETGEIFMGNAAPTEVVVTAEHAKRHRYESAMERIRRKYPEMYQ